MKRIIIVAFMAAITVFTVFFCSCGNSRPDVETQADSTEKMDETVRYGISYKKDFYIPLYDWYRKQQRTSDGRSVVYWNNKVAKTLSCNWINVFPSGKSRDGERGLPGAFLLDVDRIIEYTAKGLEDSHKLGIKIMTSAPISEVFPDTWTDWGYDPDLIRAVCTDGSLSPVYSNGVSHACHNNIILREKLFEYVEKVAKAGFDGCLFDGNSYGCSPGFFCQCEFCIESWKKYSSEKLGREFSLPKKTLDMSNDIMARAFFVWRMDSFSKLLVELRETGRKYNPDFEVYLNGMMYEIGEYYYFKNGLDVVTSEYSSNLDLGHNSTLFMFAMNEAITDKRLISFIQNYKNMFENDNEYYSVMAEAYAAGGAMCVAEVSRSNPMEYYVNEIGLGFSKLITGNEDAFRSSGNRAETAVVYSWMNGAFSQMGTLKTFEQAEYTMIRENWAENSARRASALLARNSIPFDYIVAEENRDVEEYDTLVLSEQEIISIELEDKLAEFVKKGGNLLIFGNCFGEKYPADSDGITLEYRDYDLLEKIAGKKFSLCGKYEVVPIGDSKIVVCKNFMRTSSNEGSMVVDGNVRKAFSELDLDRQVKIEKKPSQGYVETTYRSNAYGSEFYLHLINLDVNDNYVPERYAVSVEIPDGAVYVSAEAFSPFSGEVGLNATESNGRINLEGEFGIYSMVIIKYRY